MLSKLLRDERVQQNSREGNYLRLSFINLPLSQRTIKGTSLCLTGVFHFVLFVLTSKKISWKLYYPAERHPFMRWGHQPSMQTALSPRFPIEVTYFSRSILLKPGRQGSAQFYRPEKMETLSFSARLIVLQPIRLQENYIPVITRMGILSRLTLIQGRVH